MPSSKAQEFFKTAIIVFFVGLQKAARARGLVPYTPLCIMMQCLCELDRSITLRPFVLSILPSITSIGNTHESDCQLLPFFDLAFQLSVY